MPYMDGPRKARDWERNNFKEGRSGGKSPVMPGPIKSVKHNPMKGGGITRETRGTTVGKKD